MSETRRWREPAPLDPNRPAITGVRIIDEILARRGMVTPEQVRAWLNPDLLRDCAQIELRGLDQVLGRIGAALSGGEAIRIFGDYDCDGVTSTAILYQALSYATHAGGCVTWELPSREQGYGLRPDVLERAIADEVALLIAVDCGSNDLALIGSATDRGLDVVVVDHHQIVRDVPDDAAVVNPQRDEGSPLRILTAAGLAYLMVVCLAREGFQVAPEGKDERFYLDLAAIGTIGDVGQLIGLNRAIAREGVLVLNATRRQGLRALARLTKVDLNSATAETIAFKISPKLNAPGRIGSPDSALRLLLAPDMDSAEELAREVVAADAERRIRTELVASEVTAALAQAETLPPVIVLPGEHWSSGVLGPVAAKVAEQHGRPAIILAPAGENLGGSGRSVGEWDLAGALQKVEHLLVRHGGHAKAAGLEIERSSVDALREALSGLYAESGLDIIEAPGIQIDADIGHDPVSLGLVEQLELLGPFGAGNERPILRWQGVGVRNWEAVGKDRSHAQVWLTGDHGPLRAIYFGGAQRMGELGPNPRIDVLMELSISVWNQARRIDARLIDLQLSD